MIRHPILRKHLVPLALYAFIITAILVMKFFIPWQYVTSVSALLMLSVPYVLRTETSGLRWDARGVIVGIVVSLILLLVYTAVISLYGHYTDKSLVVHKLSYSFILTQLFLVALPEEVFFRGYLQEKLGNTIRGVIVVSLLFALGHFITLCLGGGHGLSLCVQSLLTFFPSLVMGYLYLYTGTLWAGIIFHFLANIVHIALVLS